MESAAAVESRYGPSLADEGSVICVDVRGTGWTFGCTDGSEYWSFVILSTKRGVENISHNKNSYIGSVIFTLHI